MHRISLTTAALALAVLPTAAAVTGPWAVTEEARVRLVSSGDELGLDFELEPGWHVYWKNSGDAGYPPRLDFSATPAVREASLLFPAPHRFDLPGGLVSFGYEGRVLYPIAAQIERSGGQPLAVRARLDYLVCREACIPHTAELLLEMPAPGSDPGAEAAEVAGRLAAARAALPRDPGAVAGAPQVMLRVTRDDAGARTLELTAAGGSLAAASPDLIFEAHPFFALDRPQLQATAAGLRFRVGIRPLDETKPVPASTTFSWTLTGLERTTEEDGRPAPVALAGSALVEIPTLPTAGSSPGSPPSLGRWGPAAAVGLAIAVFLLYRFRRSRRPPV